MKIFLISQDQNSNYDTFDSAVVAAPDEETAKQMNPANGRIVDDWGDRKGSWCGGPEHVIVRYLGDAVNIEQGVICSSFNAG